HVIVTEVDTVKALEAAMDGFMVMPMSKAATMGNVFITVTGDLNVIRLEHVKKMKDGAIVCNSGHFNAEIDLPRIAKAASKRSLVRPHVEEFKIGKKRIFILAEGRLINLAGAEGHPAMVMDMSFANQALASEYVVKNHQKLGQKVYTLPDKVDVEIAGLKLKSMGVSIDKLTAEQKKYLSSWEMGT
ncbi:MAG TPA: adenosylhomocysteinase, partial [candidate division Zixibacteria bacterium]|nr:adenosylhomocysteinase [candidate division Zixibacteria bacterium]